MNKQIVKESGRVKILKGKFGDGSKEYPYRDSYTIECGVMYSTMTDNLEEAEQIFDVLVEGQGSMNDRYAERLENEGLLY